MRRATRDQQFDSFDYEKMLQSEYFEKHGDLYSRYKDSSRAQSVNPLFEQPRLV